MKANPLTVSPNARFAEIGQKFIANRFNYLYVTKATGSSAHFLARHQKLLECAGVGGRSHRRRHYAGKFSGDSPSTTLGEALDQFSKHDGERLPVVSDSAGVACSAVSRRPM